MGTRLAKQDDLESVAAIYAEAYNAVSDENWTVEAALSFVQHSYDKQQDLFYVVEYENEIIGAVFGIIKPWTVGNSLSDIDLFIDPKWQGERAGKQLLNKIIDEAIRKYQIKDVSFIADAGREYPFSWYQRLGMVKSSWVYMSGEPKKVLDNLNLTKETKE